MKSQTIRILCIEDEENCRWSAQCLEYDLAAQAKSFRNLLYEIQRVINGHIVVSKELGIEPFTNLKRAPAVYWQIFDQTKTHVERDPFPFGPSDVPVPALEPRIAELELNPA